MDVTALLSVVYAKISASSSTEEILILSKIAEKIKIGNVRIVNNYSEMFDSTIFDNGTLFFVESEEKIYSAAGPNRIPLLILNSLTFSWGTNNAGQLGDNTAVSKSSPVSVVGGFTDWIQLSGGQAHTVGIRINGTAWSWGSSSAGQLGDNTVVSKSSPVSVVGGFTDWNQVSAGRYHTLGLRANGTAWAWGSNAQGRLGDNTIVDKSSPVLVAGGFTDWTDINAGGSHSLGIRANGTAWAWGFNSNGQLGDGTTVSKSSPVSIVGGFTDWIRIDGGNAHNVGLRANGTAWAWGYNQNGRLGDGTIGARSSPVSVVGGFTDWVKLNAADNFSSGLRSNSTIWTWGANNSGQLGDNTTVSKSSPVSIVGGFTNWVDISSDGGSSIAIRSNGTAWSWGNNVSGRLGDGTGTSRSSPVSVTGGFNDWVLVNTATGGHSFGIRTFR